MDDKVIKVKLEPWGLKEHRERLEQQALKEHREPPDRQERKEPREPKGRQDCRDWPEPMAHKDQTGRQALKEQPAHKEQLVLRGQLGLREQPEQPEQQAHRAHRVRLDHRRGHREAKGLRDSKAQSRQSCRYKLSSAKSTLSFCAWKCQRSTSRIYSWSRRAIREVTVM